MVDEATEITKETFLDIISSNYSLSDDSIVSLACVSDMNGDVEACTSLLEEGISKDVMPYWSAFIVAAILFLLGILISILSALDELENLGNLKSLQVDMKLFFFLVPSLLILGVMQLNFKVALGILHVFPIVAYFYGESRVDHDAETGIYREVSFHVYAKNIFQDPFYAEDKASIIYLGQVVLIVMYFYGLYDSGPPDFTSKKIYAYYCLGIFLQVAYSIKNDVFHDFSAFWTKIKIAESSLDERVMITEANVDIDKSILSLSHFLDRKNWDALINLAGTTYIMVGLPIQIARQSNPLDFVLNVLAAFYVIEFDNLGEPKELVVTGVRSLPYSLVDVFDENIKNLITEVEIATETKETLTAQDVCMESLQKQYQNKRKFLSDYVWPHFQNQEVQQPEYGQEDEEEDKKDPILIYVTEQRNLLKTTYEILTKAMATALTEIPTIDANTISRIKNIQEEAHEAIARELDTDRDCQDEEDEYVDNPNAT